MTVDLAALAELHVKKRGHSMEPDPAKPGFVRQTAYCPFCAAHRPDEDPRWPCEISALVRVALAAKEMKANGYTTAVMDAALADLDR
jgi:hypothetical protein